MTTIDFTDYVNCYTDKVKQSLRSQGLQCSTPFLTDLIGPIGDKPCNESEARMIIGSIRHTMDAVFKNQLCLGQYWIGIVPPKFLSH